MYRPEAIRLCITCGEVQVGHGCMICNNCNSAMRMVHGSEAQEAMLDSSNIQETVSALIPASVLERVKH